jgi:hypothetical protein
METFTQKIEIEPKPRDVSTEFLQMDTFAFRDFLRSTRNEPLICIKIDWVDEGTAKRLKAFLEDSRAYSWKQKRSATIRATEEQWNQALNVFASGVKWEKV